jgi:translation initiation factor 5B
VAIFDLIDFRFLLQSSIGEQKQDAKDEFVRRLGEITVALAKEGLNSCLYVDNTDFRKFVSIVPTSAKTGEGLSDLLYLIVQLTQQLMRPQLLLNKCLFKCTVLEVKQVEGLGTTIDVILVNGVLREGDLIVVCGLQGPIVSYVRSLLLPQPMKEMRVKVDYTSHKQVNAACGIRIVAQNLEHALAGTPLFVCEQPNQLDKLKDAVMEDYQTVLSKVDRSGQGVYLQASTVGSLEALLTLMQESKIPVAGLAIGTVHKKDVIKAGVMLEHRQEYATILAFDVKISPEARKLADEMGVRIFTADIIYHLFDKCLEYFKDIEMTRRNDTSDLAVFPVVLEILSKHIYRTKDPLLIGCLVKEGIARIGTPLCVPTKNMMHVGKIIGIQHEYKDVQIAKKGMQICVKIEQTSTSGSIAVYGRHFDHTNELVSILSRHSIDLLKTNFKDDLTDPDWKLVIKLKSLFNI